MAKTVAKRLQFVKLQRLGKEGPSSSASGRVVKLLHGEQAGIILRKGSVTSRRALRFRLPPNPCPLAEGRQGRGTRSTWSHPRVR
jgi:hypothetical protein